MSTTITGEQIKQMLDNGDAITLVEALPQKYFEDKHLPGALNIPHDEISTLAPKLLPDKDALVVVYCASTNCQNSALAAKALDAIGYTNVAEYVEGKQEWLAKQYPVESSRGSKP